MNNIEEFDRYVGEYLAQLYSAFPRRIEFDTLPPDLKMVEWRDFSETDFESPDWPTKRDTYLNRMAALASEAELRAGTADWLLETGYFVAQRKQTGRSFSINYADTGGSLTSLNSPIHVSFDIYTQARLSPKGLEVLHSVPKSLSGDNKSLGDKLTDQIKDVGTEGKKQAISQTVGEIIGAAIRGALGGDF